MKPQNNKGPAPCVPSSCSVPPEAYVGTAVPAAIIQAATSKRCKVLGIGGFGKVFAGELPGLAGTSGSSKVAIKVATSGGMPALIHEATIMRLAAAHPNVVSLLGSCWEEGHEALITEYCPGSDLDHYIGCFTQQQPRAALPAAAAPKGTPAASTPAISSSKPEAVRVPKVRQLGWLERLRVTYQVAAALAFMHQGCGVGQQVLHLDIKPGNVLLDAAGNAKLIDFGIARVVATAAAAAAATSGPVVTPAPAANSHSSHAHNQHQQQHHAHLHGANSSSSPGSARDHHQQPHHHPAAGVAANSSGCGRKCPASAAEAKLASLAARGVGQGQVLQDQGWAGTPDYLDPLYEQLGQLCDRSDVYSLGLIMCQLLLDNTEPQDAHHILAHAARQKALHLPKGLEAWPADSAAAYAALALRCCSMQREARPTSQQLLGALLPLVRAAGVLGGTPAGTAAGGQLQEGSWDFMAAVEAPAAVQAAAAAAYSSSSQGSLRPPQGPAAAAAAPGQLVRGSQAPPAPMAGCKGAWGKQAPAAPAHVIPAGPPAAEAWPSLGGNKPLSGLHQALLPAPGGGSSSSSSAKALHKPELHARNGVTSVAAAGVGAPQGARSWAAASKGLVLSMQVVVQAGGHVKGQLVLPLAGTRGGAAGGAAGSRQSSVNSGTSSKLGSATTSVSVSIDDGSYDASCGQIRFSAGLDSAATAAAHAAMKALGVMPAVQAPTAAAAGKAGCDRAPSGVTRVSPGPSLKFSGTYQQGVLQGSWELCTPAAGGGSSSSVWRVAGSYLWAAYLPSSGLAHSAAAEQGSSTAAAAGVSSQAAATVPAASPFAAAGAGALPQLEALTPETVSAALAAAVSATEQHLMRRVSSSCARQHSLRADGGRQHSLNMVQPL